MFDITKEILISDKDFTNTDHEILKIALLYIKNNSIYSDGNVDGIMEMEEYVTYWLLMMMK